MRSMNRRSSSILASLLATCFLSCPIASAQDTERPRPEAWKRLVYGGRFMDRFLPNPVRNELAADTWGVDEVKPRDVLNGIEHPDWSYWGGNIKKVGDQYHLFVCRWPENHPKGHMAWSGSTVVRATAPNPWGPYTPVEEIGKGHNPEIFATKDGTYALYVIGGYYHAPAITGPWTRKEFTFEPRGRRIIEGLSNLSFAPREDGSVLMVCRGGGIWVSETGLSQFEQVTNRRAYPDVAGRFEDPVIWKTNVQYHMIVNDWLGRIAWYLRSKDGFVWKVEPGEAYVPGIDRYENGTIVNWYKYERLKVLQDGYGRAYQASFAVIDYSKWEDKADDIHSSKYITIPLTVGRLLTVLNKEPIGPSTEKIRVRVSAEPEFDPQKDMEIASLRFGAPGEVNFGRGCNVIDTKADGADLILTFDGQGHGLTDDNFAGKLLGKTSSGKLLFGFTRLPGVHYGDAFLSSDLPVVQLKDGKLNVRVDVKNYGLSASKAGELSVRIYSESNAQTITLTLPSLAPHQQTTLTDAVEATLDADREYRVTVTAPQQSTPLFDTEEHKKAPQLKIGR